MDKNIKDRTIEFVKYKGITMKSFELKCGLSTGYVTSMRKGFGVDKLNNVLTAFPELNRDWLLYGEGEMLRPTIRQEVNGNNNTSIAGNSNHIANVGNDLAEKFLAETAEMRKLLDKTINQNNERLNSAQQQITKSQEQIDRLLTFIERMQTNK